MADLRKAAGKCDAVYLAGDPDREGEAICAHLAKVLGPTMAAKNGKGSKKGAEAENKGKKKKKGKTQKVASSAADLDPANNHIFRVMFNEITPKAIRAAFEHPGQINTNLVDAQQARRVLDRLVGYKISPLLWDKVRRGLSAGRVQTVALRLIVEREREIRAFTPVEYWTLHAQLAAGEPPVFEAKLSKYKDADIEVHKQAEADAIVAAVEQAQWQIASVAQKEKRRFAPPPFTTSKLQQAGVQPPALHRQAHHGARAAPVRRRGTRRGGCRRADHLYAHRFRARFGRRARSGARIRRAPVLVPRTCRKNPTSTNRKRTRRKRTKRCVLPTLRAPPRTCGRF